MRRLHGPSANPSDGIGVAGAPPPALRPRSVRVSASDRSRPWWRRAPAPPPPADTAGGDSLLLPSLLAPDGVVVWDEPVAREEAVAALLARVVPAVPGLTAAAALRRLAERDALGSTHVGEGVDLPHARIDAVERPVFAVGLTRGGVEEVEAATDVVWLLLLPPGGAGLRTTAQIARACRDETFRGALRRAEDDRDLRTALARWERAHEAPPGAWTQ